jgi:hypothetical protein
LGSLAQLNTINNEDDEMMQAAIMASMGMMEGDSDASSTHSAQLYEEIKKQHEI